MLQETAKNRSRDEDKTLRTFGKMPASVKSESSLSRLLSCISNELL